MKRLTRPMLWVTAAVLSIAANYSCQKDVGGNVNVPAGSSKLSVFLADGPTDYQKVLIDVQQIAVKIDTCQRNSDPDRNHPGCDSDHDSLAHQCEIWDTLPVNAGVYDLLTLRNGLDTLLSSGFVLNGKIERIKITLGNNNSVFVDSVSYPLNLIGNQNFVYIDVHREHLDSVGSNDLQLYLDFDLQHSIKYFNGQYWLKPVLKPFGRHSFGEIEGKVTPAGSYGLVTAFNATDTAYALPWHQGEFKIRGLREGTYSVLIEGIYGYRDSIISNVIVQRNRDTRLGTIQLHQ